MSTFASFNLFDKLYDFLSEEGIKKPTEVQEKAIPLFLEGKSLSVLAQTGTGKTLAYALPLFHQIKINDEQTPMEEQIGAPKAVILTPTRELNQQVFKVFKGLSHHGKLRIRQLIGGDGGKRSRSISEQAYDILICSPGRFKSALDRKEVDPKILEYLVLDEADQLLDMGFTKELMAIHKAVCKYKPKVHLFSATWPAQYEEFVANVFTDHEFTSVQCQGGVQLKRNIETFNIYLGIKEKEKMVQAFVEKQTGGTGVIFTNKKEDVLKVFTLLTEAFPNRRIHALHGDMTQAERKKAYDNFTTRGGLLISSDIAARGLDVKALKWILNYDLPFEAVYYVHRCGRVGRAGGKGEVYNFVTPSDSRSMARINEAIISQSSLALKVIGDNKKLTKKTNKKAGKKSSVIETKKVHKKKSALRKKTPRYKKKKRGV